MSNLKVEGKVGDFCLNCKNCKAVTRIHDGKNASIRIIEVDCEDPYDGMVKTLDTDSDICCSMFEPKPPCGWKDAIDTNDKMIGEKDKQIEELTRRYNMIAKKLNDIHDILKEGPNNE